MRTKIFLVGVVIAVGSFLLPHISHAAISSWEKAASMTPKNATDFTSESFKQSLANLKSANANAVSLIVPYYTSNCQSSNVEAGWNTPSAATLTQAISYARGLGLQVALKPHLEAYDNWGGACGWRASITPSDRNNFFTNYLNMLKGLASLGPNEITIGSELISVSSARINPDNTARWKSMISQLRASYPGIRLNYSANWGSGDFATETNQIQFWGDLDDIGISAYYEHWTPTSPASVPEVVQSWDRWNNSNIKPLNSQFGKPVKFTEIGYQSVNDARQQPWNYDYKWYKGYNGQEQANLYEALFQYWNGQSFFNGVNIWNWDTDPNFGWPGNTDYSPQHKPAQDIITKYFEGGTLPPPPPPPQTANFSVSATTSANPSINQQMTVTGSVKNNASGSFNGIIVDMEIYNSNGNRVAQKFFDNESFTAGQTKSYTMNWTPDAAGNYKVAMGVFGANWSPNYIWNGETASFSVGSVTPPPQGSCPTTVGTGNFLACYFDNADLTGYKLSRTDNAINFDWGSGSPDPSIGADTFSAQWQGNFTFETATYNFIANSDDGIRVWIDGNAVLDKWIDQPPTTYNFSTPLTSGTHLVKVQYYENTGGAVAKLSWTKQTTPPPPSESCSNTAGASTFNSCYFDNADLTGYKLSRTDNAINFDWGNGSPDSSIGPDTFSAQWLGNFTFDESNYNFSVTSDDGIRIWLDSTKILDKWFDQPPTTYNFSVPVTAGTHLIKVQYYENTGGAQAKVSWSKQTVPPPPPSTATLEIWWPTEGVTLSGTQPFQAIISSTDLSQYKMYWQVDGDTLNLMADDNSGYPHKVAWVDVSGWTWKGNGPYAITFVAKDLSNQTLSSKTVNIYVSH